MTTMKKTGTRKHKTIQSLMTMALFSLGCDTLSSIFYSNRNINITYKKFIPKVYNYSNNKRSIRHNRNASFKQETKDTPNGLSASDIPFIQALHEEEQEDNIITKKEPELTTIKSHMNKLYDLIIKKPQDGTDTVPIETTKHHRTKIILKPNQKRKLQTILDHNFVETGSSLRPPAESTIGTTPSSTTTQHPIALWNHSELIPSWMKEYFDWHTQQRKNVTSSNWKDHRWLVMSCINGKDSECGGTSDRLKPILFLIRQAYEMNRILVIFWTRPMELEHFLLPPIGGIDWRVPSWLRSRILEQLHPVPRNLAEVEQAQQLFRARSILCVNYRSQNGAEEHYEEKRIARIAMHKNSINATINTISNKTNTNIIIDDGNESSFKDIYHDVWRILFTPVKPVAEIITNEMNRMGLVPGEYAAAHVRGLYAQITKRSRKETEAWTQNALNCASNLRPGGPIFFSSELVPAVTAALDYNDVIRSKYNSTTHIVSRSQGSKPIFHLDKMEFGEVANKTDPSAAKPSDFYETFVDLYLLGMSSCLTYGNGGFGQLGSLIGYNASCWNRQRTVLHALKTRCEWTEPVNTTISANIPDVLKESKDTTHDTNLRPPIFLEPMKD